MKEKKEISILVIFNHGSLSKEQVQYLYNVKNIIEANILYLSDDLKKDWSSIDTLPDTVNTTKIEDFIIAKTVQGDYVLVQGEFGAVFKLVNFCFKMNRIPIYATSKRISQDFVKDDGSVEKRAVFKFVRFREYEG